jgi:hypothetical protein
MARLRDAGRRPTRAMSTRFLMQVSIMALERWDRLTPEEQARYRTLAQQATSPGTGLSKPEQKELKTIWRKLRPRKLIAEAVRLLASGQRRGEKDPKLPDFEDEAPPRVKS